VYVEALTDSVNLGGSATGTSVNVMMTPVNTTLTVPTNVAVVGMSGVEINGNSTDVGGVFDAVNSAAAGGEESVPETAPLAIVAKPTIGYDTFGDTVGTLVRSAHRLAFCPSMQRGDIAYLGAVNSSVHVSTQISWVDGPALLTPSTTGLNPMLLLRELFFFHRGPIGVAVATHPILDAGVMIKPTINIRYVGDATPNTATTVVTSSLPPESYHSIGCSGAVSANTFGGMTNIVSTEIPYYTNQLWTLVPAFAGTGVVGIGRVLRAPAVMICTSYATSSAQAGDLRPVPVALAAGDGYEVAWYRAPRRLAVGTGGLGVVLAIRIRSYLDPL
jgi:hypothetical protein